MVETPPAGRLSRLSSPRLRFARALLGAPPSAVAPAVAAYPMLCPVACWPSLVFAACPAKEIPSVFPLFKQRQNLRLETGFHHRVPQIFDRFLIRVSVTVLILLNLRWYKVTMVDLDSVAFSVPRGLMHHVCFRQGLHLSFPFP